MEDDSSGGREGTVEEKWRWMDDVAMVEPGNELPGKRLILGLLGSCGSPLVS